MSEALSMELKLRGLFQDPKKEGVKSFLYSMQDLVDVTDRPPTAIKHWLSRLKSPYNCGSQGRIPLKTVSCKDGVRRYGHENAYKYYNVKPGPG